MKKKSLLNQIGLGNIEKEVNKTVKQVEKTITTYGKRTQYIVKPISKSVDKYTAGYYNVMTGEINLGNVGSEKYLTKTLIHEDLHKALFEDKDIPSETTWKLDILEKEHYFADFYEDVLEHGMTLISDDKQKKG